MNRLGAVLCVLVFAIGIVSAGCGGYVSTNPGPPVAPSITTQPASQTVTVGQTATLRGAGRAPRRLGNRGRREGSALTGGTHRTTTRPATPSADNGRSDDGRVGQACG